MLFVTRSSENRANKFLTSQISHSIIRFDPFNMYTRFCIPRIGSYKTWTYQNIWVDNSLQLNECVLIWCHLSVTNVKFDMLFFMGKQLGSHFRWMIAQVLKQIKALPPYRYMRNIPTSLVYINTQKYDNTTPFFMYSKRKFPEFMLSLRALHYLITSTRHQLCSNHTFGVIPPRSTECVPIAWFTVGLP